MAFYWDHALEFATEKHKGQHRIGGESYITHPLAVADYLKLKGFSVEHQFAGLFHDLLEDTDATIEEITNLSSEEVAVAVQLLTKQKGYDLKSYLNKIETNEMALVVKIADRIHNLKSAKKANLEFRQKYIAESFDYYFIPAIMSPFYSEFRESLDALHETITEEFYCKGCKAWHDFSEGKVHYTRDKLPLCGKAIEKYEVSFKEYEKFLEETD